MPRSLWRPRGPSEDSTDSEATDASSESGGDELPDLTERIVELGVYDEYMRFREGYSNWRAYRASRATPTYQGAIGEASAVGKQRSMGFFAWYPNYKVWQWRRTISYWITVTFFEGSAIFTISCFLACHPLGERKKPLVHWSFFAGGIFYLVGTYLMCIETLNLGKRYDIWWPLNWTKAVERLDAFNVSYCPYIASVTYFLGAVVYTIPVVLDLLPVELPFVGEVLLIWVPYILAGLLFCLGGLAECIDNEVFTSLPSSHAWVGAVLNFLGGLLFFVAGLLCWYSYWWVDFLFGWGSLTYTIGSLIMMIMWKDEQFGLTFLSALNKLEKMRAHGPFEVQDEASQEVGFSLRGLIFLVLYVLIGVMCVYNFNLSLLELVSTPDLQLHLLKDTYFEGFTFILLHLWIAMLAAVVRVPKPEPYRTLFLAARWWSIPLFAISFMSFYEGVIGHFV